MNGDRIPPLEDLKAAQPEGEPTTDDTTTNTEGADNMATITAPITEAPKRARKPAKKAAAKPAPAKARRSAYPAEITEAVRLAKQARGTTHGAPGAKQHVLVREALGKNPTAASIIKASGVKSEKQLRAIANGTAPREDLAALKPLAAKFDDSFCKGRNLASILVAALTQAKAKK